MIDTENNTTSNYVKIFLRGMCPGQKVRLRKIFENNLNCGTCIGFNSLIDKDEFKAEIKKQLNIKE